MFKLCQRIHGSALNTEKSRNFDVYQNVLSVGGRVFSQFDRIAALDSGILISSSGQLYVQFSKVLHVKSIFGGPFPGDQ